MNSLQRLFEDAEYFCLKLWNVMFYFHKVEYLQHFGELDIFI